MKSFIRNNVGLPLIGSAAEPELWSEELLRAKGLITKIQKDLRHDEDWPPMLVVESNSPEHPNIVAFTINMPYDEDEKDAFAASIRDGLIHGKARAACLIGTAWAVAQAPGLLERYGRVSQCPNRKEILYIFSASYGGSSHGFRSAIAHITRRAGMPPQLTNWNVSAGGVGRFASAIWSALCEVNR